MSGERALIYSRIRENRLDPSESDLPRGARQQAVIQAVGRKFTSIGTLLKMPFEGASFVKPLTTDLSTGQLLQLGWLKFRSADSNALHCRLGGDISSSSGETLIERSEDNLHVHAKWSGDSAPHPPAPGAQVVSRFVLGHVRQDARRVGVPSFVLFGY